MCSLVLGWIRREAVLNMLTSFGLRGVAIIAQFGVLLLVSRMLSLGDLGDFLMVYAGFRMIGFSIGTGIGTLVLYHVSRAAGSADVDRQYHVLGIILTGIICLPVLLAVNIWSDEISGLFSKSNLSFWIREMSPFLGFQALSIVATGSLDGRGRIGTSIAVSELFPNLIQVVGLAGALVLSTPVTIIGPIFSLSLAAPWMWLSLPTLWKEGGIASPSRWDIGYASKYGVTFLLSQQINGLDVILVGLLYSSEKTAFYTVCARIAMLFPFVQVIVLRKFAPVAGLLISKDQLSELNSELARLRPVLIAVVGVLVAPTVVIALWALPILGVAAENVAILISLSFLFFSRAYFGGIDVLLKMSGRATASLLSATLCASLGMALAVMLGPSMGIFSVGVGLTVAASGVNIAMSCLLMRRGFRIVDWRYIWFMVPITLSGLVSFGIERPPLAAGFYAFTVAFSICVMLFWSRRHFQFWKYD